VNSLNTGYAFFGIPYKKEANIGETIVLGELKYNIKVGALDENFNLLHVESNSRH